MTDLTRRKFLKNSAAAAAGIGLASTFAAAPLSRVKGANDTIRMAVIGCRNKGAQHLKMFHDVDGVQVVALCDVDESIRNREAQKFKDRGESIDTYRDFRKVLDRQDIDAVAIATPNHWHTPIAIRAIQAGKDVYVEKPVSHNIWEGEKLLEAARKYDRIVQAGTQNRSDVGFRKAVPYIKEGNIGKILWAHGLWYKRRGSIGKIHGPQPAPETVDYNLWTGPAPMRPLQRKELHYDWHWQWATGNGDMGNLGPHQVDDCRWVIGQEKYPRRVLSYGGRYLYKDDAETPNIQVAIYDYEPAPMIIEIRNLPVKTGANYMDNYRGIRSGNIIQCEHGYFAGGRGGGIIYDNDGKKLKDFPGDGGGGHQANFIEAVRKHDRTILHAEIAEGVLSSALCHLGNISYRTGGPASVEAVRHTSGINDKAVDLLQSVQKHLQANDIDLTKDQLELGSWVSYDPRNGRISGEGQNTELIGNALVKTTYRDPFEVPQHV